VIWGSEYFRPYLYGIHFRVETDNTVISWLRNNKKAGRLTRWGLRLSDFDFSVIARPGTENGNTDGPSWLPIKNDEEHPDIARANRLARAKDHDDIPARENEMMFGQVAAAPPGLPSDILPPLEDTSHTRSLWRADQIACPEVGLIYAA
jgi:hypothetical protein